MASIILGDGTKWHYRYDEKEKDGRNSGELPPVAPIPGQTIVKDFFTKADTPQTATKQTASKPTAAEIKAQLEREKLAMEREEREKKRREINKLKARDIEGLGTSFELSKHNAQQNNAVNLRDIYIAYMQSLRDVPQQQALMGAGGEAESLKYQNRINYQDNRAKENRSYSGILAELEAKYNEDLLELEQKYLSRLLSL